MDNRINELYNEIKNLEQRINKGEQTTDRSIEDLKNTVEELQKLTKEIQDVDIANHTKLNENFVAIDKEISVQGEKLANIYHQLGQIERRVKDLEKDDDRAVERSRSIIDRIVIAIIGGLVTYIFGTLL